MIMQNGIVEVNKNFSIELQFNINIPFFNSVYSSILSRNTIQ